jgi:hypothetical protein
LSNIDFGFGFPCITKYASITRYITGITTETFKTKRKP